MTENTHHHRLLPFPNADRMRPIHTPDDLLRHWRVLIDPLGFARRTLWYGFVDAGGSFSPIIQQLDRLPAEPLDRLVHTVITVSGRLLAATDHLDDSVAFLLSRPGGEEPTQSDEAWARALLDAGRHAGLALLPPHLATDHSVRPLDPDRHVAA